MNKGFTLKIGEHKYRVITLFSLPQKSKLEETSNTLTLSLKIYEDEKLIKLDKNSYAMEKISDFIENSLNGQDSVYWDFNGKNRFEQEE